MMAARLFLLALLVGSSCAFAAAAAKTSRATGDPIVCSTVNQHISDPDYCEGYYLCDFNLVPERIHCASGLFFNPTTDVCDLPATSHCNAAACTLTKPQPDKVNCAGYYECPGTVLVHGVCDDGLFFDPSYYIPTLGIPPCGPFALATYCHLPCTPSLPAHLRIPDPFDCNSYYQCSSTTDLTPTLTVCPAGNKYNPSTGTCVYDPTFC